MGNGHEDLMQVISIVKPFGDSHHTMIEFSMEVSEKSGKSSIVRYEQLDLLQVYLSKLSGAYPQGSVHQTTANFKKAKFLKQFIRRILNSTFRKVKKLGDYLKPH